MHIPQLYIEEDKEKILEFLRKNIFPALVTHDGENPIAINLHVEVIEDECSALTVLEHLSRESTQEVLIH